MKRVLIPLLATGLILSLCSLRAAQSVALSAEPGPAKSDAAAATPPPEKATPAIALQKAGAYAEQVEKWQAAPQPQSFEPILALGQEAATAIIDVIEELDEKQLEAIRQKMPGYQILSDEILVVAPDPVYLSAQAKQHGTPADIAFFDLMGQTLNGYWPVTLEQLDSLTGCVRYGSHDLIRLYGAWKNFQKQYPDAYKKAIADPDLLLLTDIEDQLVNGLAACDGPESVADEFQAFIKTYPDSDLVPRLKERLKELNSDEPDIVFYQGIKYNSQD